MIKIFIIKGTFFRCWHPIIYSARLTIKNFFQSRGRKTSAATFIFRHCLSFLFSLFFLRAPGLTGEKRRALRANHSPPHLDHWLALFVANKTMRARLKRLRWERGAASPPPWPSQGRADCPGPAHPPTHPHRTAQCAKVTSQCRTSPPESDVGWQIITRGFIKR